MNRQRSCALAVSYLIGVAGAFVSTEPASAKHSSKKNSEQSDQVSMSVFPIDRGYDGQEFIITKQGFRVMVPGLGIAPNATQIAVYRDNQNDYWYINKTGAPTRITSDQINWVQAQIQAQMNERNQQGGMQSAAPQMTVNQTVINQASPAESSRSGVSTALVTGLAAAGGAAAGAAIANSAYHSNYYGIPYGTPVYRGSNNHAYYVGPTGNKVYVSNNKSPYCNQWEHQKNWNNLNNNQKVAHYNAHAYNNNAKNISVNAQRSSHSSFNGGRFEHSAASASTHHMTSHASTRVARSGGRRR